MKQEKANGVRIKEIVDAAKAHFSADDFRFYWDGGVMVLSFSKSADRLAVTVFCSLVKRFNPNLPVRFGSFKKTYCGADNCDGCNGDDCRPC